MGEELSRVEAPAGTDSAAQEPGAMANGSMSRVTRVVPSAGPLLGWLRSRRLASLILLALLGFTLAVEFKSLGTDEDLSAARLEDLVRIQSDLEAREQRLRREIAELEESQRQLATGAQRHAAALEEATRQADELGILAGTLPARGPGLSLTFIAGGTPIGSATILDAVQELRGAGAEAMQISGRGGASVRIVASTYFLGGDDGGLVVDGHVLGAPYTIMVIGDPTTMRTALSIPGGVVESVQGDGGNVIVEEREVVDVTALREPPELEHARPVS
ncbi:MAG TPA: DUF881 domain-containing protein [Micromonosporaceae bacterium]